jgi:glycerol-3-phosphate dehydrogenase
MARSLDDVLSRRTRARLVDRDACVGSADAVAALLAPVLGWDAAEEARQAEEFRASIRHEIESEQSVAAPGGGG